jgi:hypothetical protein
MRNTQNFRLQSGKIDVAKIQFDPKSRDDIPQILKGLQYIYTNCSIRDHVFGLLEEHISPEISKTTGRPGMDLWTILVLGVLRLDLNCDYDLSRPLIYTTPKIVVISLFSKISSLNAFINFLAVS